MRKTEDLFDEAISLPVEKRTLLVDKLLQSLNPTLSDIDKLWAEEAENRVKEISGRLSKNHTGREVFSKIRERIS